MVFGVEELQDIEFTSKDSLLIFTYVRLWESGSYREVYKFRLVES